MRFRSITWKTAIRPSSAAKCTIWYSRSWNVEKNSADSTTELVFSPISSSAAAVDIPTVGHSNDQYRRVVWRCNAKYRNQEKCTTPHLTEDEIQSAFVSVMNRLITNRKTNIADCKMLMKQLTDCAELTAEEQKLD